MMPLDQDNNSSLKSFEVIGLVADQASTPTGMTDEIILLSWLIVLLRVKEDMRAHYDWTYQMRQPGQESQLESGCLSTDDVMESPKSSVFQVASEISKRIAGAISIQNDTSKNSSSLILSTGCQLEKASDGKVENILHLEAQYHDGYLQICPVYPSQGISPHMITRYVETLVDIVRICIRSPSMLIEDFISPIRHDMDEIWQWNKTLPPTYNCCMHDIISERAQGFPNKVAISSWDGSLTYAQVDRYSTLLASTLRERGVQLNEFLPICFEKSKWTVVAVLAVMKAGGTMVLMDPVLPLARLRNMAEQVNAKTMIVSRNQHDLSASILPNGVIIVLDENSFVNVSDLQVLPVLPAVPPSTLMYIIFTSGSTGTPKGVQISHKSYSSSAFPRAKAVGYTNNSRVLDFASYAFDVSIDSMLLTLANGGCLCIPSDEERLNDINKAMRRMKVNYAGLTPSVARILDLDVIASLEGLGLGGEAASVSDITLWGQYARIIIGYGPCECTIGCTVNSSAATGQDYVTIGPGNGAVIWIVDPDNCDALMPVGAVGELLVEGPIVGQGYLNDPDKTAAAFVQDPSWLVSGHGEHTGRRGRLYKTGDLGKYAPDGSGEIVFVGRKDTQVKLRGQRVELGEIESQLKARLPPDTSVISEVITPSGPGSQPTLVAFVAQQPNKGDENRELESTHLGDELREILLKTDAAVAKVLPRYMIPAAYIPINYIPTLISGKIDRKRLRAFGSTVNLQKLDQNTRKAATRTLSDLEQRLRQAWGSVLKLNSEDIGINDNFFALGGNSLAAMRLVSVCRDRGLDLSVAGTFANPTLSEMASVAFICDVDTRMTVSKFSMISQLVDSARREAAQACETNETAIEDIYPCTPTQESLFTFSMKSAKPYIAQRVACIPANISLDIWKQAWELAVAENPMLRTRLVQLQDPGLQQVVLNENIIWKYSTALEKYLEDDKVKRMDLGQCLARYAIINSQDDGKRYMVWTVHHVLYDGWSEPIILEKIRNALQRIVSDSQKITQTNMREFVKYIRDTDQVAMRNFWRQELEGAVDAQFPRLPSRDFLPNADAMVERRISTETHIGFPFTLATVIRGAWALVASQYTASDDVVFGETLTGRDIPLPGVEGILGPLIATIPVRIRIDRTKSIEDYLKAVQRVILIRTPYQHMGMQNIRKVSQDAQHACEAGTGLVIQLEPEYDGTDLGFNQGDVVREALHFNPYPLMLACGISSKGFRVCASFDSSLIDVSQMERILKQLDTACSQLMKDLKRTVNEISCLPEAELNQIWSFNHAPPLSIDEISGKLRANTQLKPGSMYPQPFIPWVCNPRNPSLLSPIGCPGELWLEGSYFLSNEAVESPMWLLAGSSEFAGRGGKVQATGDIVYLQENGGLVFVGRTEDIVPVNGHAVDITGFESHLTQFLPPTIRAAAAIHQPVTPATNLQQPVKQELIVFIEQQLPNKDSVKLMSDECIISCEISDSQKLYTSICAATSITLVRTLKRLDKFIRNSLPTHMVPLVYVIIDRMPLAIGHIDHGLMNQLASCIDRNMLLQLRESLETVWNENADQKILTDGENILRAAWAKVLGVGMDQIDVDDNFFRLGGDSVSAMKLASSLLKQGYRLSVADIFQHMRLGDAAKVLKVDTSFTDGVEPYKAFSMLGSIDVELFLSEFIRPKLADKNWLIKDVFVATDSQVLDVKATVRSPRTSMQYTMLYFDNGTINQEQLLRACADLVKTHEILRTVFVEHNSTLFQLVLEGIDIPVSMQLANTTIDKFVSELCTANIESEFRLGASFVRIFFVENKDGQECLVLGLSHALYDGVSLPRLLRDLEILYMGGKVVNFEPFSMYMARNQDERMQTEALNYWDTLLDGSTLSILPGKSEKIEEKAIFKTRHTDISKPPEGITTASLLTAAFAIVLARRLRRLDVSFGGITSGRSIHQLNIENVMGPCYQFTPIRVVFQPGWSAIDLLNYVQRQSAESAAHDVIGFERISKQCTQWASGANFFDSIVHHQDFEDFDSMPFAHGHCRVEILNPHGDAAYPLKVVSFFRKGNLCVGVVGNKQDLVFIDSILDELVVALNELVSSSLERTMLQVC